MILVFVVAGWFLLMVVGFGERIGGRIHPAHRVWLTLGVLVTGFFLITSGLVLWSAPIVLDLVGLTDLASWCRRMVGGVAPGGVVGGVAAGVAAAWLTGAALRGGWNVLRGQRLARIESLVSPQETGDEFDLFVVESTRPTAYTVGGGKPQIVISSAVVDGFTPELVAVIVAHERVHARNRHHRFLALTAAVENAVGWLHPVAEAIATVRVSLERWADEDAALMVPDGRQHVKRALLTVCMGHGSPGVIGFGSPEMVSARVHGLEEPPPRRFSAWMAGGYLVFGVVAAISAASVGSATRMSILAVVHTGQCLM